MAMYSDVHLSLDIAKYWLLLSDIHVTLHHVDELN